MKHINKLKLGQEEMALFGSNQKTNSSSAKIRPTIVRTRNVAKELVNIAKSHSCSVDSLDFNIIDVQTFTRINEEKKEAEWEEIEEYELHELDDDTALLNKYFQIMQMYEVEIFSKNKKDDPYKDFHIAVGANASKCKVYLSIKQGSKIQYNPRFEKELLIMINKSKIRAGVLIDIFDDMLSSAVSKISSEVRVQESIEYEKNETILIAQSPEPTPTKDDQIILHYDEKEEIDDNSKVDHAQRGFIQSVNKDELLIEYIKPIPGKAGRNCRGEFLIPKEASTDNFPTFTIDDTIKKSETDKGIEYHANENGYIALDDSKYTIQTDVDVGEISFKTTGSISTGLDSDVSISVKETDSVKDAIGTGMEVEVSEIHIEGNVGSAAKVVALTATIDGQTHKTAMVRADNLRINNHKGSAYGKNIKITRLEHGTVDGDEIEISQAIGGDVRGKNVTIELCGSYVNVTASKIIEIKKLQGSENTFTIDPILKKSSQQSLNENKTEIEELENDVKNLKAEIEKYTLLVEDNKSSFDDVKKRLMHYKKNNVKMPAAFVKQYKEFKKIQEHLVVIKKEYLKKKELLILKTTSTSSFQDDIFEARIINRDKWKGHNEIKFILVDPPIELTYRPEEGSPEMIFAVVEEDDQYEIRAVKE